MPLTTTKRSKSAARRRDHDEDDELISVPAGSDLESVVRVKDTVVLADYKCRKAHRRTCSTLGAAYQAREQVVAAMKKLDKAADEVILAIGEIDEVVKELNHAVNEAKSLNLSCDNERCEAELASKSSTESKEFLSQYLIAARNPSKAFDFLKW